MEQPSQPDVSSPSTPSSHTPDPPRLWHDGLHQPLPPSPTPAVVKPDTPLYPWRIRDRLKTTNGALVVCLNIGVDPPGVTKPTPCARLECWTHPNPDQPVKSLTDIVTTLKTQYERWQAKARYKVAPDPTVTDLKRICVALRRAAKDERVLFHYNGHGVPRPTANGEIWVFNHNYSQYIPLNLFDLHEVLGSPALYIFDCNSAGTILSHFQKMTDQFERDWQDARRSMGRSVPPPSHRHSIMLAACADGQLLPTTPHVPADLFTSCLTTPIKTVLRWYARRSLVPNITPAMLDRIPGNVNARNTPLGELEYIFTAVTDTIAWNVLPRDHFKKLYRQDLLLSSLMRNFLLADRIMRSYACTPVSYPELPQTHNHPLWRSFDLAIENVFSQLSTMLAEVDSQLRAQLPEGIAATAVPVGVNATSTTSTPAAPSQPATRSAQRPYSALPPNYVRPEEQAQQQGTPPSHCTVPPEPVPMTPTFTYRPSTFFEDHMKAFNVWLDMGPDHRDPPEQLPIMLQVLLSPVCRLKALPLISRYMQTGPVAVDLALSVGIFPYVLRLLHNQSPDIRKDLVFIWSKILALDDTCRVDLVKDKVDEYFVRFLNLHSDPSDEPKPVYLACAMFVLSVVARTSADRSRAIGTVEACFMYLTHESLFVRRWACLCLTEVFLHASPPAQLEALDWKDLLERLLYCVEHDPAPDVRAAAVSTLSAIMNGVLRNIPAPGSMPGLYRPRPDPSFDSADLHRGQSHLADPSSASPIMSNNGPRVPGDSDSSSGGNDSINLYPLGSQAMAQNHQSDTNIFSYSTAERNALVRIGRFLAISACQESSVLVRRELSFAIAAAVRCQPERFVRAALIADVIVNSAPEGGDIDDAFTDECEEVQRSLWVSLSELAFDPHPVAAAISRRSYDLIYGQLTERTTRIGSSSSAEDIPATDHAFSPPGHVRENDFIYGTPDSTGEAGTAMGSSGGSFDSPHRTSTENWAQTVDPRGAQNMRAVQDVLDGPQRDLPANKRISPLASSPLQPPKPFHPSINRLRKGAGALDAPPQRRGVTGIHVRSASGSFDLNVSSRLPNIPRTNSATMFPSSLSPILRSGLASIRPDDQTSIRRRVMNNEKRVTSEDGPSSFPHVALAKGVGNLVKTVSQQLNLSLGGSSTSPVKQEGKDHGPNGVREKEDVDVKATSPPRPPKRSVSYQVLGAAASLSPKSDSPLFSPAKHSSYFPPSAGLGGSHENLNGLSKKLPSGYDRLYLSGAGNAALTLYEWSSAYISRVEFDAETSDYTREEAAPPRFATLWNKLSQSSAYGSVADNLRRFALLGKGDDVLGPEDSADQTDEGVSGNEINQSSELSLTAMGAGGGAVSAMTFLPRDMGIGDDQLLATGDSNGSVGVYDARTGKCQGAFGIPLPPGVPEEGVSSIMCLNPTTDDGATYGSVMPNSHSALILAGAYDGRVAVFKSDFSGPNYRIMSTFQASGRTVSSGKTRIKAGRQRTRAGWLHQGMDVMSRMPPALDAESQAEWRQSNCATTVNMDSGTEQTCQSFADMVRQSGNGLVVAFKSSQAYLAAAGCDNEIVRIWDLERERCTWEGWAVAEGTWPTAVSMWKTGDVNLFVVGSSDGSVNLVDMRERPVNGGAAKERRLGLHSQPVISIGTCPPERGTDGRELVVSADVGGEIVFWDPRWHGGQWLDGHEAEDFEMRRIGAHTSNLTAMAVHQTGRYLASGSSKCVKIFGPGRSMVKMISHHERGDTAGGMSSGGGKRISAVTSLAFQHESSLLAVGCMDSSVMIYGRDRDLYPGV